MNKGLDALLHTVWGIVLPLSMEAAKLDRERAREARLKNEKVNHKTLVGGILLDVATYGAYIAALNWEVPDTFEHIRDAQGFVTRTQDTTNVPLQYLENALPYLSAIARATCSFMIRTNYIHQLETNAILERASDKVRRIL